MSHGVAQSSYGLQSASLKSGLRQFPTVEYEMPQSSPWLPWCDPSRRILIVDNARYPSHPQTTSLIFFSSPVACDLDRCSHTSRRIRSPHEVWQIEDIVSKISVQQPRSTVLHSLAPTFLHFLLPVTGASNIRSIITLSCHASHAPPHAPKGGVNKP